MTRNLILKYLFIVTLTTLSSCALPFYTQGLSLDEDDFYINVPNEYSLKLIDEKVYSLISRKVSVDSIYLVASKESVANSKYINRINTRINSNIIDRQNTCILEMQDGHTLDFRRIEFNSEIILIARWEFYNSNYKEILLIQKYKGKSEKQIMKKFALIAFSIDKEERKITGYTWRNIRNNQLFCTTLL